MDAIEGYKAKEPTKGLYNRHKIEATLEDGKVVTAWVYEYNGEVKADQRIENGIW